MERFTEAQKQVYGMALNEIKNGRKKSHWMWFIFPQLKGLGRSSTAHFYGIENLEEAAAYLNHEILGSRLIEISKALLSIGNRSANDILGSPDDLKLHSSMTLFAAVPNTDAVFQQILNRFFDGKQDPQTITLLRSGNSY